MRKSESVLRSRGLEIASAGLLLGVFAILSAMDAKAQDLEAQDVEARDAEAQDKARKLEDADRESSGPSGGTSTGQSPTGQPPGGSAPAPPGKRPLVRFIPPGGFFEGSAVVALEADLPGDTELRYTTDGETPTTSDALYQNPLVIERSTTLRVGAFREDRLVGPVASSSYFVDVDLELPVMSFTMDHEDYREVHLRDDGRGRDSERPAHLTVFDDGQMVVGTGCGLRLHGGASRSGDFETKKSYRCYFRGAYGAGTLEYPIIPDTFVDRFDKLVLRAGFNDSFRGSVRASYLRDQIIRDLHEDMGMLAAHGSWLSVFVNMKWRGVFNVVERVGERFLRSYTGDRDWDVIKTGGEVQAGDAIEWKRLREFLVTSNLADDDLYQEAARLIDIENFTSYMLVNVWAQNHDWPHRNWYAARPRRSDGRWTFLCWDGEFGVGLIPEGYEADTFEFIFSRQGFLREVLESLLANAGYRQYFIEEADRHRFGTLWPERVLAHVERLHDLVEHDMDREAAAFGRDPSEWADNVQDCVRFARYRGPYFFNSIATSPRFDFPKVTTPRILRLSRTTVHHTGEQTITVSGARMNARTEFYFNGLRGTRVRKRRVGTRHEIRVPFDLDLEGPVRLTAVHPVTRKSSEAAELITVSFPRPVPRRVTPPSGSRSGGELVRITGEGFLPGVEVWFGGTPALQARRVDNSSEVLAVVTPPGKGATDLVVINQVAGGAVPAETSLSFEYRDAGFVRGDVNGDGEVDITDGLRLLSALASGADLECASAADSDDSGFVDITDGVRLLGYLFGAADAPVAPFPRCGVEETPDRLSCGVGPVCN